MKGPAHQRGRGYDDGHEGVEAEVKTLVGRDRVLCVYDIASEWVHLRRR